MRFMVTFRIPPEGGNAALKDGRLTPALQSVMEELQPEAGYFAAIDGARGGYLVVNMDDGSQLPSIAEPLFLGLGATVKVDPVFTLDEIPTVADQLEQLRQKFG
jgi:hypothetical protein